MNKRMPLILLWRMILPFKITNPRQCWNAKMAISQNHARYRKDYQHESSIKYKDKTWCQDLYKMHQIHYIWGREEKITITKLQYIYPTTNNMLWIGPYDQKHQNHGIGLTGAQDSAGVPRFTSHHLECQISQEPST